MRTAFGTFLTGVTVVTTREQSGLPRGFTANSFTSVSLDPPMLLICVDRAAESFDVFTESQGFAVNILAEDQTDISGLFASKRADKFDVADWKDSETGYPILAGTCAWFNCRRDQVVDAGDHVIIIGEILGYDYNDSIGLGYVRGGYMSLELERSAAKAEGSAANAVVGAVIECNGKIWLDEDEDTGAVSVPASGLNGMPGSLNQFQQTLNDRNIKASISSLFSVFENKETDQQSIYYRAKIDKVSANGKEKYFAFAEIPWDRIASPAIVTMLKRYVTEAGRQRFGVYFGSDKNGSVKTLSEE